MIKNYFKVAVRYLTKYKGYTFINVLGLSVGIACCILIMLFVKSELSFDRFHSKADRIHRAWMEEHYQGEILRSITTPIPLGPVLKAGLPEAEATCRIGTLRPPVRFNDKTFTDPVSIVDSNFFQVFDFELMQGNITNPFPNKNSILLTEEISKKYFGQTNPVGKDLELTLGNDTLLFTVTALLKNPRLESTLQFGMLIPFSNAIHVWSENARTKAWSNVSVETYVLLKNGVIPSQVHPKIASIMNPLVANNYKPGEYIVQLQSLKDLHFGTTLPDDVAKPSDPKYSYILSTIGILILLIACINFVTLSIGRSTTRALEVGIRKVLGAERQQLIRQFWGEALLLTVMAMLIGVGMAFLFLGQFNQLANRELVLSINVFTLIFCLILMVIIGLLAGIYPAFVLSNFKPIEVLKGKFSAGNIGLFRKALIVGQFVASIVMIIGTFSIGKQLDYLQTKDLGYNKEHIVVVSTNQSRNEGNKLAKLFKSTIQKNPQVTAASASLYSMAEYGWMNLGYIDDKQLLRQFKFNVVDPDFVPTMKLKVIAGRNFSKDPVDSNYVLVNESFVKEYGWQEPLGQRLPGKYEQTVIGVVKDFHIESLHTPIKPTILALKPDSIFSRSSDLSYNAAPFPRIAVRFAGGKLQDHIEFLKASWKLVAGDLEFDYRFLDDALNTAYEQELRLGKMVKYASFLSIFIACMGLFGLVTLIVVRRTKEIGIRKVLGADVSRIVLLLSKDFVVLVIIAAVIASPIAWWGLQKWLQDFAYRIDVPWLAFIGAVLMALLIALATVSFQAIKVALTNPVKNLRTE